MASKTATKSQSKSSGATSSTNTASKSAGAKSISSRTYDSGSNTWVGNGVTSFSSDGSQSNGSKSGAYALTQEKSPIGWVPVATKVEPVAVASRSTGSGPGSSGILGTKNGNVAAAKPTAGPGNPVAVVRSPAQTPIRLGEIVVTASKPAAPASSGPGVALVTTAPANQPRKPKGGSLLAPAFNGPSMDVTRQVQPGDGYQGGYRYTPIGLGLTWASPNDFAKADKLEDEMGDAGSLPFQGWKIALETVINTGRLLNTMDAPLTNSYQDLGNAANAVSNNFGAPSPRTPDYSRRGGGTGTQRPW